MMITRIAKSFKFAPEFFLGVMVFSIPFSIQFNTIAVITVAVLVISIVIRERKFTEVRNFFGTPYAILMLLQFMILIGGLGYSTSTSQGIYELERGAALLAILIIVYGAKKLDIDLFRLIFTFFIGCLLVTFIGLVKISFFLTQDQRELVFQQGHTFFTDQISIHPSYLSIYYIFTFFFLLETLRTKETLKALPRIGIGVSLIFIIWLLFFLRSQMGLLVFIILSVVYAIIILKRRAWLVTFVLFTVGLVVFLLDSNRVSTFFDTYGKNVSTALDQRFSVWRGTIEGIKMSPIFGAGTGGEQQLINKGYAKIGYQEGIDNSYNAHNQYLQFLARNGILELSCFLAFLFYSFKKSLETPNYTFLMFNMAVTLIMFTESFLNVQKGIVFFYFFVCAFIFLPYESASKSGKSILN